MTLREINLLTLNPKDFLSYVENLPAKYFVSIHQEYFKDYYLSEPEFDLSHLIDEFDMFDTITEKYREFFNEIGIDATHKWLNPSFYSNYSPYLKTDDFTMDMIKYELGLIELSDELLENSNEMFSELYGETFSAWGYSAFMNHLINEFENEFELEECQ